MPENDVCDSWTQHRPETLPPLAPEDDVSGPAFREPSGDGSGSFWPILLTLAGIVVAYLAVWLYYGGGK